MTDKMGRNRCLKRGIAVCELQVRPSCTLQKGVSAGVVRYNTLMVVETMTGQLYGQLEAICKERTAVRAGGSHGQDFKRAAAQGGGKVRARVNKCLRDGEKLSLQVTTSTCEVSPEAEE